MSFARTIAKGFGYSAAAIAVGRFALFLNFALLTRLLSPGEVGMYSTAWVTIGLFATLSVFGVHTTTARMVAYYRVENPARIGQFLFGSVFLILCISIGFAALAGPVIAPLAGGFVHVRGFGDLIALVIWNVPFLASWMVLNAGLQGMEDFPAYGITLAASGILIVPLTWWLTKLGGLKGALWATVLTNALVCCIALWSVSRCLRQHSLRWDYRLSKTLVREVFSFSLPLLLGGVLISAGWWLANLYLAREHGFSAVGYFAAGFGIFQALQFLPNALSTPYLPVLTGRFVETDTHNFNKLVDYNFRFVWILSLPVVTAICLLSRPLSSHLFGQAYVPASQVIRWMAMAGLLSAVTGVMGVALISVGHNWIWLCFTGLWFALFGGFTLFLAPSGAADGVAQAAFLSVLLSSIFVWRYFCARLNTSFSLASRLGGTTALAFLLSSMGAATNSNLRLTETIAVCMSVILIGWIGTGLLGSTREERLLITARLWGTLKGTRNS